MSSAGNEIFDQRTKQKAKAEKKDAKKKAKQDAKGVKNAKKKGARVGGAQTQKNEAERLSQPEVSGFWTAKGGNGSDEQIYLLQVGGV